MVLFCAVIVAVLVYVFTGDATHLVIGLAGLAGVACATIAGLIGLVKPTRKYFHNLAFLTAPFAAAALSFAVGSILLSSQLDRAKSELQLIVSHIEETKRIEGRYPKDVAELIKKADLPKIVRGEVHYSPRQDSFDFWFSYKGAFIDGYYYDSKMRTWKRD